MADDPQSAIKARIKTWLKQPERSREWLAGAVGSTPKTVDNWLSSNQGIPKGKLILIQRLMEEDEAGEARRKQQLQPQAQIFSVEVDLPTFRAYSAAALASAKTLEQWAIAELNAAASRDKESRDDWDSAIDSASSELDQDINGDELNKKAG